MLTFKVTFVQATYVLVTFVQATYEYERQEPAPRRGLAPPVLIFQTSPSCNIFTKIPNFLRNWCQPSHKGLILPHSARTWILNPSCALMRARVGSKIMLVMISPCASYPPTRLLSLAAPIWCGVPTLV